MKRFLVTILSVMYLASATGATVHVHYCMGKFAGISLIHHEEGKCSKCGMEKAKRNKGCCKDEQKVIKVNDHQQGKIIPFIPNGFVAIVPSYGSLLLCSFDVEQDYVISCTAQSQTVRRGCPIYLEIRNLRI